MFPYVEQPVLRLGPIALHAFGALVGSGVLLGYWMLVRRATARGLEGSTASGLVLWMVSLGFVGAHILSVVFSQPQRVVEEPLLLLKFWEGLSSFGGVLSGILAGFCFLKLRRVPRTSTWVYMDVVAYVFPFAWILGRAGCSLAHDHPGIQTASWLAVRYPDGPRYDLGLLEFFYAMVIAGLFLILDRRPRPTGFYFGLFFLLYGPVRFFLDTLRVREVHYFSLTSGQYGSILAVLVGLGTLIMVVRQASEESTKNPPARSSITA